MFILSAVLAVVSVPFVFVGFWPLTLLLIIIAIGSFILWVTTKLLRTHTTTNDVSPLASASTGVPTQIIGGDPLKVENRDNKTVT
jgi:hypothetical protein